MASLNVTNNPHGSNLVSEAAIKEIPEASQTHGTSLIALVIRTNQILFIQSRAGWQLTMTTFAIMGISAFQPYLPLAQYLGFAPLPWQFWPLLGVTLVCYVGLTQPIKQRMMMTNWV